MLNAPENRISNLDALRGISIAMVMFSHAFEGIRPTVDPLLYPVLDGSIAVRMFFVISGYLITRMLLRSGDQPLKDFYLKRLTKLFPTLALFVGAVFLAKTFFSASTTIGASCENKSFLIAVLFLTEIFRTGCWDLEHTWSVSVEEIFYLAWPFLLLKLKDRRTVVAGCLVLLIAIPILRGLNYAAGTGHYTDLLGWFHPVNVPLLFNLEGIAVGALIALLRDLSWSHQLTRRVCAGGMLFAMAATAYVLTIPAFRVPAVDFLKFLSPLSTTFQCLTFGVLVYRLTDPEFRPAWVERALSWRPLIKLGVISYSTYIWQQIILRHERYLTDTWYEPLLRIAAAILVGYAAFRLVENPVMLWLRAKLGLKQTVLTADAVVTADTGERSRAERPVA